MTRLAASSPLFAKRKTRAPFGFISSTVCCTLQSKDEENTSISETKATRTHRYTSQATSSCTCQNHENISIPHWVFSYLCLEPSHHLQPCFASKSSEHLGITPRATATKSYFSKSPHGTPRTRMQTSQKRI